MALSNISYFHIVHYERNLHKLDKSTVVHVFVHGDALAAGFDDRLERAWRTYKIPIEDGVAALEEVRSQGLDVNDVPHALAHASINTVCHIESQSGSYQHSQVYKRRIHVTRVASFERSKTLSYSQLFAI